MPLPYTTILFDADDTLLDFHKAERTALKQVLGAFSIPATDAVMERYSAINAALWRAFERGEVTKDDIKNERYRRLFAEFSFDASIDTRAVNDRYLSFLSETGFTLPGALELCKALKAHGYTLYIITNGVPETQKKRMERSGLAPFFSGTFVSEAIGAQKPFPAFFDYVLAHIGETDKRRILIVGDSLGSDIQGAANAGLDCVWFNEKAQENDRGLPVKYTVKSHAELQMLLLG